MQRSAFLLLSCRANTTQLLLQSNILLSSSTPSPSLHSKRNVSSSPPSTTSFAKTANFIHSFPSASPSASPSFSSPSSSSTTPALSHHELVLIAGEKRGPCLRSNPLHLNRATFTTFAYRLPSNAFIGSMRKSASSSSPSSALSLHTYLSGKHTSSSNALQAKRWMSSGGAAGVRVFSALRLILLGSGVLITAVGASMMAFFNQLPAEKDATNQDDINSQVIGPDGNIVAVEEPDDPYKDENAFLAGYHRARDTFKSYFAPFFEEPITKLLPDPLPPPYDRPYTLVLDLDKTLIASQWNSVTGWKTLKRPGLDQFLAYLGQYYEIILYCSSTPSFAIPTVQRMDPQGYILYKLYRDSTKEINGKHVKDLSAINRDLSRVIMVDDEKEGFMLNPENGIQIKKWEGEPDDRQLLELIPFLELIVLTRTKDVRAVIRSYEGKDVIEAFKENQRRIREEAARKQQQLQAQSQQQRSRGLVGILGKVTGQQAGELPTTMEPASSSTPQQSSDASQPLQSESSPSPTLWQRIFG